MARSQGSFGKRQKEMARKDKQLKKQARRQEAREKRAEGTAAAGSEDPDLAGIQLGPQPAQTVPPAGDDATEEADDADDADDPNDEE